MQAAAKVYRGEYRTRYIYHAQMEPVNATAPSHRRQVGGDLGRDAERDRPAQRGRRACWQTDSQQHHVPPAFPRWRLRPRGGPQEVMLEAVRLTKAVGKPVKLIWSREDDLSERQVPPDDRASHRGGLRRRRQARRLASSRGRRSWSPAYTSRAATGTPPPTNDRVVMKGSPMPQYPIPNKLAEHVIEARGARLAAFRGVGIALNAFAVESFLDEIAKEPGQDPIEFRLGAVGGRAADADAVAHGRARCPTGSGRATDRGLGVGTMVKDETLAAGVAEVSVDRATGKIKVHNFWAAIDAGLAVQPTQCRGADRGQHRLRRSATCCARRSPSGTAACRSSNYSDYEVTRMSDVPNIEVKVVSTDNPPTGAGEDGVPLVACAVGNAIAALTGVRLRELPFAPERVRGALGA